MWSIVIVDQADSGEDNVGVRTLVDPTDLKVLAETSGRFWAALYPEDIVMLVESEAVPSDV